MGVIPMGPKPSQSFAQVKGQGLTSLARAYVSCLIRCYGLPFRRVFRHRRKLVGLLPLALGYYWSSASTMCQQTSTSYGKAPYRVREFDAEGLHPRNGASLRDKETD